MFWDNVAGVYDVFVNVINRRTHAALRNIVSGMISPDDTVLECACGTGLLTSVITGRCRRLIATDLSGKMLEKARKNCRGAANIDFMIADITALSFPDDSFDKVVAGNVIHLLDDPQAALSELERVCRPGGKLIIPTYINKTPDGKTRGFARAAGRAGADFRQQFTAESYREFFRLSGHDDVEVSVADGRIPCAVAVMGKYRK